jgi:hypothetical protein
VIFIDYSLSQRANLDYSVLLDTGDIVFDPVIFDEIRQRQLLLLEMSDLIKQFPQSKQRPQFSQQETWSGL